MQRSSALALLLLIATGCGGVSITPTADPVSLSVSVTVAGKPANDINFNFQPVEGGLPATVLVTNGKFEAQITPGKYTYFITAGKSPAGFKPVPAAFHAGSLERLIEVKAGEPIDIKLE